MAEVVVVEFGGEEKVVKGNVDGGEKEEKEGEG